MLERLFTAECALVEAAYANGAATIYLACRPVMLILLLSFCLISNRTLGPAALSA